MTGGTEKGRLETYDVDELFWKFFLRKVNEVVVEYTTLSERPLEGREDRFCGVTANVTCEILFCLGEKAEL